VVNSQIGFFILVVFAILSSVDTVGAVDTELGCNVIAAIAEERAKSKTTRKYNTSENASIEVSTPDSALDKTTADTISETIAGVNLLLDDHLAIPAEMKVIVGRGLKDGYNWASDSVSLNSEASLKVGNRTFRKHPKHRVTTTAHEYTHSIFDLNTRELLKTEHLHRARELGDRNAIVQEIRNLEQRIVNLETTIKSGQTKLKSALSPEESLALKKELREQGLTKINIKKQLDSLNKKVGELDFAQGDYEITLTYVSGYDELFADLVAVILTEDPKAIEKSVDFAGMRSYVSHSRFDQWAKHDDAVSMRLSTKQERARLSGRLNARRFSSRPGDGIAEMGAIVSPHELFAGTRAFLGKYYLSHHNYRNNPKVILEKVFDAIVRQIKVLQSNPKKFAEKTLKEINQDLNETIEELLPR